MTTAQKLTKAQQALITEIAEKGYTRGYGQNWKTLERLCNMGLVEHSYTADPDETQKFRNGYVLTEKGKAV